MHYKKQSNLYPALHRDKRMKVWSWELELLLDLYLGGDFRSPLHWHWPTVGQDSDKSTNVVNAIALYQIVIRWKQH